MINKISTQILKFVSRHIEISSEMTDIYRYGIEITISSILNILLILVCSLIVKNILAGIVYLFVFISLRTFSGGYHATTYFRCNLILVVTFIVTYFFYKVIAFYNSPISICEAIALLNLIPIALFSPVPNKHKPLSEKQKKVSYELSLIIASVLSLGGIILIVLKIYIGTMIILTVTMVSVLIIIETILQRRGYHEN